MKYTDFPEFSSPQWDLLASVQKPSRYTGSEWIAQSKDEKNYSGQHLSFCLAFPDVYEIGMSYVGFQILYSFLANDIRVNPDRAYCPWIDMEEKMRAERQPLFSTEGKVPLKSFDVLGFTLQHELTYTNILTMLDLSGIPLRTSDRKDDDPLVIAGGPGALVPEPLADFIDVFCLGDGESFLPDFIEMAEKTRGASREERLKEISSIPGAYVPSFYVPEYSTDGVTFSGKPVLPVSRVIVKDLDDTPYPENMIVPNVPIVHDRIPIEIFRGCSRGCRFCQAGMIYRPVRERKPETVLNLMNKLLENTGWDEVGLVSLASCDYSGILEIVRQSEPILKKWNARLSLPSLRMDSFSVDLATRLENLKRGSITFAPEAGSQRLRNVINKGVTDEDIDSSIHSAFEHGWQKVKLYFMMGLPEETYADLDGIADISRRVFNIGRKYTKRVNVNVSVAGFIPKPHTPFQWEPQNSMDELARKGKYIKSLVRNRRISIHYHDPSQSFLEGVLARGDRRLCQVIETAWENGARFDGWTETFSLQIWMRSFDQCQVDPGYYNERERSFSEKLPWEHIDTGVSRDFLLRERKKASESSLSPDCRWNSCNSCGLEKVCFSSDKGDMFCQS